VDIKNENNTKKAQTFRNGGPGGGQNRGSGHTEKKGRQPNELELGKGGTRCG